MKIDRSPGVRVGLGIAGLSLVLLIGRTGAAAQSAPFGSLDLRDAIDTQIHLSPSGLFEVPARRPPAARFHPSLVRLYHERDMEPVWTAPQGPNENAVVLRSFLEAADTQGLEPRDYAVDQIGLFWDARDVRRLARLELLLTVELAEYVSDLVEGRSRPRELSPRLFPTAHDTEFDPAVLVQTCLTCGDLRDFLESQAPPFRQYRDLRSRLAEYRAMAARGGWASVPPGPALKPGQEDPRVPALRRRLLAEGFLLAADNPDDPLYDESLQEAIERFQRRHGQEPDGVVGPATLAALNVSAAQRVRQIILNMESWRWVWRDPGNWLLMVNIPSFTLTALRGDTVELSMPVIVGRAYHMTPVFSDRIRYVEFNPYWNVPSSIARNEMLPKLRKDASYLAKEHIRLFQDFGGAEIDPAGINWADVSPADMNRYHLRQDPGPFDALGTVAFRFPNAYSVYLHDTPSQTLFQQSKRTFSHGCIRCARPRELAVYVLGGLAQGWDEGRVDRIIAAGQNETVHLESSLPIFILYNTAVIDPETHQLNFYEDVYGRDALLEKALFR